MILGIQLNSYLMDLSFVRYGPVVGCLWPDRVFCALIVSGVHDVVHTHLFAYYAILFGCIVSRCFQVFQNSLLNIIFFCDFFKNSVLTCRFFNELFYSIIF